MDETVRGGQEPGEAKAEPGADGASPEPPVVDASPTVPEGVAAGPDAMAPLPGEDRPEPRPSEPLPEPADAAPVPEHIFVSVDEGVSLGAGQEEQDAPAPPPYAERPSLDPDDSSQADGGVGSSEAALSAETSEAGPLTEASPSEEVRPVATHVDTQEAEAAPSDHQSCDDPPFDQPDDRSALDEEADAPVLDEASDGPPPVDDPVPGPITLPAPDRLAPPAEPPTETFIEPAFLEPEAQPTHSDAAAPAEERASEQAELFDGPEDNSSLSESAAPPPDAEPAADAPAPQPALTPAIELERDLAPPNVDVPEVGAADPTAINEAPQPLPADDAPEPPQPQLMPDPPVHASLLSEPPITAQALTFEPVHPEPDEPAKPLREDQIWSSPEADAADQHRLPLRPNRPLSIGAFAIQTPSIGNAAASRAMEQHAPGVPAFPSVSLPSRETLDQGRSYVRLAAHIAGAVAMGLATTVLVLILLYRWIDPPTSTLMLGQRLLGTEIEQRWVPIERVSPHLIQAIILSEDGAFCRHRGVDWAAMSEAIESARGGSTITMQVVKNLFLWPARSYVRKALEIALAYMVEVVWSKQRILEIYLNIAEWGPGVFGAEAAARNHFGKRAAQLTPQEAALLAVSLPNPIERQAGHPGWQTRRLASNLLIRMRAVRSPVRCARAG